MNSFGKIGSVFDPAPERMLANRYRMLNQLGQGGMGSVWRAEDRSLRIEVAIKLIDPALTESPEALSRFEREAHAAASLRSTHIVHINDYGVDPTGGQPYIAMDLLEGESLASRIASLGKISFPDTLRILSQVASALELAHGKGIVHRDLKPDNLFITREGHSEVVKVLDFGIAKKLDAQTISTDLKTRAGQLLGTPYYMSPEQAQAKSNVDHRTDIWAFGVLTYECITGLRPFEHDNLASLLLAICSGDIPRPSRFAQVPSGFDQWFARAVARDLEQRFSSIGAAISELEALRGAALMMDPTSDRPEPTLGISPAVSSAGQELDFSLGPSSVTAHRTRSSRSKHWTAAVTTSGVVLVGALGYWLSTGQNRGARATATVSAGAATPSALVPAPSVAPEQPTATAPSASAPSVTVPTADRPVETKSTSRRVVPSGHVPKKPKFDPGI